MRRPDYKPPVYIHPVQERIEADVRQFILGETDAFPPPEITQKPDHHRYLVEHPGLVFRGLDKATPLISSDVEKAKRDFRRQRYTLIATYGRRICKLTGQDPADFLGGTVAEAPQRTNRRGSGSRTHRDLCKTERIISGTSGTY